jgi:hypothetical protein
MMLATVGIHLYVPQSRLHRRLGNLLQKFLSLTTCREPQCNKVLNWKLRCTLAR